MTTQTKLQTEKLKCAVVQAGRALIASGLVAGTWGNISARIPGTDTFVITPSGKNYMDTVPDDLVIMNLAGEVVEGNLKQSSEYHLHLFTYQAKRDIQAVVHTHSIYASAHAVARIPIPVGVEDMAMIVGGSVQVAPYALPGTEDLANNALEAMGDRWAVLLANHGVVGIGRSLDEAMRVCHIVEKSARIYISARSLGQPFELDSEDVQTLRKKYLFDYGKK
jgi:L-fuculose-phosphate aldolase